MKPVYTENIIARVKSIISDADGRTEMDEKKVLTTIEDIEKGMKSLGDQKEAFALLVMLSVLIVPLSGYLLYNGFFWPSLILVSWIGALLYYKVNERSLSISVLKEKAQIRTQNLTTKVNYLLSGVHQKLERLTLIKALMILFWPFAIFMGQLCLNASSPILTLWVILVVIFAVNAFFWIRFFKPQQEELGQLHTDLLALNAKLLLGQGKEESGVKLFQSEEE